MTLPDHIRDLMRAVEAEPDNKGAAMCLSDELRDWANDPAGYVPRPVLVGTLKELVAGIENEGYTGWAKDYKPLLSGQCPAWFVIADWERMTDEERESMWRWVESIPVYDYDRFTALEPTPNDDARLDWLANELRTAGHVPEGWRLEWSYAGNVRYSDEQLPRRHHHRHEGDNRTFATALDETLTFTRWRLVYPEPNAGVVQPETVTTYIGRCEQCRTVYATRPTVEGCQYIDEGDCVPVRLENGQEWVNTGPPAIEGEWHPVRRRNGMIELAQRFNDGRIRVVPFGGNRPTVEGESFEEVTLHTRPWMAGQLRIPRELIDEQTGTNYVASVVDSEMLLPSRPAEQFISLTRSQVDALRDRFGMRDRSAEPTMYGLAVRIREDNEPIDPRAANVIDERVAYRVQRHLETFARDDP